MFKKDKISSLILGFAAAIWIIMSTIGCKPSGEDIESITRAVKNFVETDGLLRPGSNSLEQAKLDRIDLIRFEGKEEILFERRTPPYGTLDREIARKVNTWVARVRLSGMFESDQSKFDSEFKFFTYKENGQWTAKLDPRSAK